MAPPKPSPAKPELEKIPGALPASLIKEEEAADKSKRDKELDLEMGRLAGEIEAVSLDGKAKSVPVQGHK